MSTTSQSLLRPKCAFPGTSQAQMKPSHFPQGLAGLSLPQSQSHCHTPCVLNLILQNEERERLHACVQQCSAMPMHSQAEACLPCLEPYCRVQTPELHQRRSRHLLLLTLWQWPGTQAPLVEEMEMAQVPSDAALKVYVQVPWKRKCLPSKLR